MANEWKAPLKWSNEGIEPSENLKANGFQAGFKPPAPVFNYFLHREQECLEQLQEVVDRVDGEIGNKANKTHTHSLDDVLETTDKKIYTAEERRKLSTVSEGATAYVHPASHPANMITGLATVATSGDYNDLKNKPTISDGKDGLPIVNASSSNGVAYVGTANSITTLTTGVAVIFVPSVVSASTTPTLNINNLGVKGIRRRLSNLGSTPQAGYANTWLSANKAYLLIYDGSYWIAEGFTKPASADLYGTVSIEKGGTGATTAAAARENIGAVGIGDLPTVLPNPKALTFTGGASGSYDGSEAKTINIPMPANTVYVTITYDTEGEAHTADKTPPELMSAYQSGQTIIATFKTSDGTQIGASVMFPRGDLWLIAEVRDTSHLYRAIVMCTTPSVPDTGAIMITRTSIAPKTLTINGVSYDGSTAVDMTSKIQELVDAKIKWGTEEVTDGAASPYPEGTLYVVIE